MILHETYIQDATLGVQQIHVDLKKLFLQFQILKKEKATRSKVHEEVCA